LQIINQVQVSIAELSWSQLFTVLLY